MPSAQKPAGAEGAERALSRDQPVAADAAAPTPANKGSASAAGAEFKSPTRILNKILRETIYFRCCGWGTGSSLRTTRTISGALGGADGLPA